MSDVYVFDEINKAYGSLPRPANVDQFQNKVFQATVQKLPPEDRENIESILRQFCRGDVRNAKKIYNLGELGMTELLAKLGMFLNAVEKRKRTS